MKPVKKLDSKRKEKAGFRFIKGLTSDVSWEAYGKNLKDVFENSGIALFSVICQIKKIKPKKKKVFIVKADNVKELMVNWLQELIASVDIDQMFYSEFDITEITEIRLKAVCRGEPITRESGETVVKAVTYHNFEFKKTKQGYMTRIVVDI